MSRLYRDDRIFFSVENDTWTALAIWALIAFPGISFNVNRLLNFIFEDPTFWDTAIIGGLSTIFILLGTATALQKMERREFLLMVFIAVVWFLSFLLNEEARKLLKDTYFAPVLIQGFCGIICISHFKDWVKFQKLAVLFSTIGSLTFFALAFLIISGEIKLEYMSFSYSNLIFVIAAFWIAIHRKNVFMWIMGIIGLLFILMLGSRGALLCVFTYILLEFLLSKKIHIAGKVAFFLLVALLFFNLEKIMVELDTFLRQNGYVSRTIQKFFEGTLQDDSGRTDYFFYSWEVIFERPLFGWGMAGSSAPLFEKVKGFAPLDGQGAYAHNLFLDLYMQLGIFGGTISSVWIVVYTIKSYFKSIKKETLNILFVFFSLVMPKLMVTDTYLACPEFFMYLGLLINLCFDKYDEKPQTIET